MALEILVNGEARATEAETVAALVGELGFAAGTLLVEHNGVALRPDEWGGTRLHRGDRIEAVRVVAGG